MVGRNTMSQPKVNNPNNLPIIKMIVNKFKKPIFIFIPLI